MAPQDSVSQELWRTAKARYPVGSCLSGPVVYKAHFGVFLNMGLGHVHALLEVIYFADAPDVGQESPPGPCLEWRYPEVGEVVTATVIDHREDNHQIYVSAKPILPASG